MYNLLKLLILALISTMHVTKIKTMYGEETSTQRYLVQIQHSIATKTTPYVNTGECLARQHITWEERNGVRSRARYEEPEYKNTPIPQEHYRSLWVQASALFALCQEHDQINQQQLTTCLPSFLAVKIGHSQSNNAWFLYRDVAPIINQLNISPPETHLADDPF